MAGYTRQSSADIIATAVVRANPLNVEYNALRDAFNASTGHKHDGTAAEGAYVPLIADSDALNKVVIDTSNNRVGVFVEVSSAAVEQIRIQDGAVIPVTNNDIDLGTSSLQFKDLFIDGTATVDALQVDANAVVTGNLTVNGNATLGNAASDTVTVTADVASPLLPSADDTYDLGAVGSEWRNLYIDGTANIDALVADTADINGGTVDGAVIGGASAAAGTFTSLTATGTSTLTTVDINGGAIDGAIIGANSAAAITGTTITGTSLVGAVTGDVTGNADTATALETARTIGGVSFDGTGNINLPGVNATGNQATSGNAATATALETARTIGGVSFDGTGNINLPGVNASGNQDTSGNAATATTLATARTIAGQSFNGSANITIAATDLSDTDQSLATSDNVQFAQVTTTANVIVGGDLTVNGTTTTINSSNMTVDDQLIELGNGRSGSASGDAGIVIERGSDANAFIGFDESADKFTVGTGTFTGASTGDLTITTGTLVANIEGNVTGAVTGNADTATALATARTIAGQSFDGTANITIAPTDLTGVNATATELNIMDGDTSATSTTLADADRVVVNDAGTMKQVALTDFETYMETSLDTLSNVTTVGALNSGSITSGFGAIDVGSSAITTTGTINFGSLADGSITATGFVDEDNMSSNSATLIPTQQSVKAYVDTVAATSNNVTGLNATGAELNTVADFSAVSVDTSTAIANNDAILMFDNGNEIGYRDVDLLDTYFSGTTKTLTNKTLTSPVVTGMHLNDSGFTVEGSGADGNETTVAFTNPTADHTITFPNATGNVAVFTAAPAAAIADGSNGQVLTTNGSGVLSFSDMASGADLYIANESSPANQPTAAGANAIGIGDTAQAAGADGVAIGLQSYARAQSALGLFGDAQNTESICIGKGSAVTADGAVQLGRNGYATAVDAVSLGKSRASGTSSFAAAIDNNTSTYGAQGTNSIAMGYQAKAAGTSSVAIGYQAQTTTANEIVLGGSSNQVKVSSAYTLPTSDGSANQVLTTDGSGAVTFADASSPTTFFGASEGASNATDSTAIGSKAKSDVIGKLAYSTFSFAGLLGQAQQGLYVLVADTTDATATVMTTNNSSASTDNQIILKNDSAMTFHGTIVARQEGDDGTDCAGWKIEGLIRREGAANTTTLLTEVVTTYYNAPNWDVSLTADTTNGGLKVEITGAASHDVRWVGTINTSELDYETYVWYGSRGIFAGGYSSGGRDNAIDYITIASTGNATDFGDLTEARNSAPASLSNGTRGVFAAGRTSGPVNTIDYITVASTGNATDFGDLTVGRQQPAGASNGSRGLIIAGFSVAVQARTDAEKLTIATTGNATLYSGTTGSAQSCTGWSNGDRAVFAIGYSGSAKVNTVEFLSIETEGNATDFGDLTVTRNNHSATGSTTRMLVVGGDT